MNKNVKRGINSMIKKINMESSRNKRKLKEIKEEYRGITIINAENDNIGDESWIVSIFDFFIGNPVNYFIRHVQDQWIAARIAANHLGNKLRNQRDNCYFIDDMATNPEYQDDIDLEHFEQNEFLADNGRVLKTEQIWTEQV